MATPSHQKICTPSSSSSSSYRQFVSSLIAELAQTLAASNHSQNPLHNTDPNVKQVLLTLHALFPNELIPAFDILDRKLILRPIQQHTINHNEEKIRSQDRHDTNRRLGIALDRATPRRAITRTTTEGQNQAECLSNDLVDQTMHSTSKSVLEDQALLVDDTATNTTIPISTLHASLLNDDVQEDQRIARPYRCSLTTRLGASTKPMVWYVRSRRGETNLKSKWRDAPANTTHYEVRLLAWSCSCPAFAFSAFPAFPAKRDTQGTAKTQSQAQISGRSLADDRPICKHILACLLVEQCTSLAQFVEEVQMNSNEVVGWAAGYGD